MKQIFLLIGLYLFSNLIHGQNHDYFDLSNYTQVNESTFSNFDYCDHINTTEQNIYYTSIGDPDFQMVANDLFVEPNTIFNLEQIVVELWINFSLVDSLDIIIWSDDNGTPSNILYSELTLVPTSQTFIGYSDDGAEVHEVIADLPNPFEFISGHEGTTYWVQIAAYASSSVGWHSTTEDIQGHHLAYNQNQSGWVVEDTPFDGVYAFIGDCEPILNLASINMDLISISPNPVQDILTINIPQDLLVNTAFIYNLSGKIIYSDITESSINLSNISNGLYFLKIETNEGFIIKKLIKR